jgi:hypothetical protein
MSCPPDWDFDMTDAAVFINRKKATPDDLRKLGAVKMAVMWDRDTRPRRIRKARGGWTWAWKATTIYYPTSTAPRGR